MNQRGRTDAVPERSEVPGGDFARLAEPLRRELLAHCYRMLGSVDEAEDLVQETYLRAWRSYESFDGRASLRTWLYRIATNACLTALERRTRRPLPSGLGAPSDEPAFPAAAGSDVSWLQPIPDPLVTPDSGDPAAVVATREQLRLALVASLQLLPPRQRAVLILREVLGVPAAEVAEMLGITTAAVKSLLQRARARLDRQTWAEDILEPDDPVARSLLEQYVAGFENADVAILERALRQDAALEVVPSRTWFAGLRTCLPVLAEAIGSPGDWRMTPTTANGQPAVAAYRRGDDGVHRAWGISIITTTPTGIARIVAFSDPGLVHRFGLPASL
jgi:RNA polymerase sigma-70 factor, ECF subfamily